MKRIFPDDLSADNLGMDCKDYEARGIDVSDLINNLVLAAREFRYAAQSLPEGSSRRRCCLAMSRRMDYTAYQAHKGGLGKQTR
jgi:hypothetical protein